MSATLDTLEQRIFLLEEVVNNIQIAIKNLATKDQMSQLVLLRQQDIESLQTDVTALQNQVNEISEEVFK